MTLPSALALWVPIGLVILLPIAIVASPLLATLAAAVFFVVAFAVRMSARLPQIFLVLLGLCLVGYAFLGRGFAYLGVPPLYVGEMVLGFGLISLLLSGGLARVFRSPLAWLLVGFMLLSAALTLPFVSKYGPDTLRDAAVWGYGIFALMVAAFILKSGWLQNALRAYGRWLPRFLVWTPVAVVTYRLAFDVIPKLPGSGVPLLSPKGGDIAVHLAGVLAFLALGLHGTLAKPASRLGGREWLWWTLWLASCLSIFTGRAAILTVLTVVLFLMLLRPLSRWGKVLFLATLLGAGFMVTNAEINLGGARSVSAEDLLLTVQSIFGETGESAYDGSRNWRLMWWTDIVSYTVFGEYFWTGKGYGINLATADGYQVLANDALRSPHNSHITFLARGGVPTATIWIAIQFSFFILLLRAHLRARRQGCDTWAKIDLWILSYWLAFMVNGAFDVFLEGPQGGIWFWSLFGFGIAALEMQRGGALVRTEARLK